MSAIAWYQQLASSGIQRCRKIPGMETFGVVSDPLHTHSATPKRIARLLLLLFFFLLYWGISAAVLWWSYDIPALIHDRYYEERQVLVLVTKMGLIITVLTSVVWLFMLRRDVSTRPWRMAWNAFCGTVLVLVGYTALILGRLQFSSTPAPDSAFLPILGTINSHFFSEAQWMIFVLNAPIMGFISGILYFVNAKFPSSIPTVIQGNC
jgi:hypothetical protein